MAKSSPTKKQLQYIDQLQNKDKDNLEILQTFLKEKNLSSTRELTVKTASELIDRFRKGSPGGTTVHGKTRHASNKQIAFIESLEQGESAKREVEAFLGKSGKKYVHELESSEASDLIDSLKPLSTGNRRTDTSIPASKKQIKYIQGLQKTAENSSRVESYVRDLNKGSIEELSISEASELITLLKRGY